MKHPFPLLFALVAIAVLLGAGSMMNSACKTGPHAWCAPPPKIVRLAAYPHESLTLHNGAPVIRKHVPR